MRNWLTAARLVKVTLEGSCCKVMWPEVVWRWKAGGNENCWRFCAVCRTLMGHSGPRTEEKCRIRGMRLAELRPSIMTAALSGGVSGGC